MFDVSSHGECGQRRVFCRDIECIAVVIIESSKRMIPLKFLKNKNNRCSPKQKQQMQPKNNNRCSIAKTTGAVLQKQQVQAVLQKQNNRCSPK